MCLGRVAPPSNVEGPPSRVLPYTHSTENRKKRWTEAGPECSKRNEMRASPVRDQCPMHIETSEFHFPRSGSLEVWWSVSLTERSDMRTFVPFIAMKWGVRMAGTQRNSSPGPVLAILPNQNKLQKPHAPPSRVHSPTSSDWPETLFSLRKSGDFSQ